MEASVLREEESSDESSSSSDEAWGKPMDEEELDLQDLMGWINKR